jgi:hypothetical protein
MLASEQAALVMMRVVDHLLKIVVPCRRDFDAPSSLGLASVVAILAGRALASEVLLHAAFGGARCFRRCGRRQAVDRRGMDERQREFSIQTVMPGSRPAGSPSGSRRKRSVLRS